MCVYLCMYVLCMYYACIIHTYACMYACVQTLADPELQKRGAKFLPKFLTTFFRRFSKNFCISPKNLIYLPKFLMMTFFSHRPFSCFMWYFFPVGGQNRNP